MPDQPDIALDYAAATPKRAEVVARHAERCARLFANPHGTGRHSTECRRAAENASNEILDLLGIPADEADLIWTSGGTEAANLAIAGSRPHLRAGGMAAAATAHACVLAPMRLGAGESFYPLPVRGDGQLELATECARVSVGLGLVGVCHVNNETGVRHDLVRLREWLDREAREARLLVDALQSAGKFAVPWREARIDLLTVGGRKLGGPPSMGALVVRRGVPLSPIFHGGGQQGNLRSGTVDVVGAVELAHALRLATEERDAEAERAAALNQRLRTALADIAKEFPCEIVSPRGASPWILCTVFEGYEGAILTRLLGGRGVAVSAGSACSADSDEISHVLQAMGVPEAKARGMVRVSFGPGTTGEEVDRFASELKTVLKEY